MNVPTSNPASLMRPPVLVAALGYGGLIPFVGLAAFVMFGPADAMAFARGLLIAYGAVILSFVGALHWGFAMTLPGLDRARKHRGYIWSVIPALMGFLAIAMDSALSLSLLIVGLCAGLLAGRRFGQPGQSSCVVPPASGVAIDDCLSVPGLRSLGPSLV